MFPTFSRRTLTGSALLAAILVLAACGSGGGGGDSTSNNPTTPTTPTVPAGISVNSATLNGHVAIPAGATVVVQVGDQTVTPAADGAWNATVPYDGTTRSVTLIKRVNGAAVSTRTVTLSAP
jgi:hypothetical protein